jgi:hypothetical protein
LVTDAYFCVNFQSWRTATPKSFILCSTPKHTKEKGRKADLSPNDANGLMIDFSFQRRNRTNSPSLLGNQKQLNTVFGSVGRASMLVAAILVSFIAGIFGTRMFFVHGSVSPSPSYRARLGAPPIRKQPSPSTLILRTQSEPLISQSTRSFVSTTQRER